MEFIEKVKGILLEPGKTFDALKEETLGETVKYYAVIAAVYSALLALLDMFMGNLIGGSMNGFGKMVIMMGESAVIWPIIILFFMTMIIAIVVAFIGGALLHIFVYIVGGRRGITQTIKAGMYGSTASLLFGWIPVIGFIAMIWSLVAEIIGIGKFQELTTGKAVLVVILSSIVVIILTVTYIALFLRF